MLIAIFSISAPQGEKGFLIRTAEVGGTQYRYQVFVPQDWNSRKKWPVVLFLHGAGERGADGNLQTLVGIGPAIRTHPERFPCIVVMPQCRRRTWWWPNPRMGAQALKALDQTMAEFNGDPDRIYLTGISMGGYATWSLAYKHPEKFAALAPICGGIQPPANIATPREGPFIHPTLNPYAATAERIGQTPVWIFHGDSDNAVPVSESRKMNRALKKAGGNVRYTEYPGVGHNSWDKAYADPEFLRWLLSHRRLS